MYCRKIQNAWIILFIKSCSIMQGIKIHKKISELSNFTILLLIKHNLNNCKNKKLKNNLIINLLLIYFSSTFLLNIFIKHLIINKL